MLSLRHIEVFRAIMTTGSVTRAAVFLHSSQPTVSRELARLEQLLGFALFQREHGRLTPSARALLLFEEVERAFTGLEHIVALANSLKHFAQGQLSIGCLPALTQALLPEACAAFSQEYPAISLEVAALESPRLEEQLSAQGYDIGLTESPEAPRGTELQPLLAADEVCILPNGHPLLARQCLQLSDFAGQNFVSLAPGDRYRRLIDELFENAGITRQMHVETHSAVSVCSMVRAGLGVALINPISALMFQGQGLQLRPLDLSLPFQVNLVKPLYRPITPLRESFITALHKAASQFLKQLDELGVSSTLYPI